MVGSLRRRRLQFLSRSFLVVQKRQTSNVYRRVLSGIRDLFTQLVSAFVPIVEGMTFDVLQE